MEPITTSLVTGAALEKAGEGLKIVESIQERKRQETERAAGLVMAGQTTLREVATTPGIDPEVMHMVRQENALTRQHLIDLENRRGRTGRLAVRAASVVLAVTLGGVGYVGYEIIQAVKSGANAVSAGANELGKGVKGIVEAPGKVIEALTPQERASIAIKNSIESLSYPAAAPLATSTGKISLSIKTTNVLPFGISQPGGGSTTEVALLTQDALTFDSSAAPVFKANKIDQPAARSGQKAADKWQMEVVVPVNRLDANGKVVSNFKLDTTSSLDPAKPPNASDGFARRVGGVISGDNKAERITAATEYANAAHNNSCANNFLPTIAQALRQQTIEKFKNTKLIAEAYQKAGMDNQALIAAVEDVIQRGVKVTLVDYQANQVSPEQVHLQLMPQITKADLARKIGVAEKDVNLASPAGCDMAPPVLQSLTAATGGK